jgi:hypothetical protein
MLFSFYLNLLLPKPIIFSSKITKITNPKICLLKPYLYPYNLSHLLKIKYFQQIQCFEIKNSRKFFGYVIIPL